MDIEQTRDKSNSAAVLADLAQRVRVEHVASSDAAALSLRHAQAAGALLLQAKAAVRHGEWLPWLRWCGMAERTAQRYMRLADLPPIGPKSACVADLTVAEAEALVEIMPRHAGGRMAESVTAYPTADAWAMAMARHDLDVSAVFVEPSERLDHWHVTILHADGNEVSGGLRPVLWSMVPAVFRACGFPWRQVRWRDGDSSRPPLHQEIA